MTYLINEVQETSPYFDVLSLEIKHEKDFYSRQNISFDITSSHDHLEGITYYYVDSGFNSLGLFYKQPFGCDWMVRPYYGNSELRSIESKKSAIRLIIQQYLNRF